MPDCANSSLRTSVHSTTMRWRIGSSKGRERRPSTPRQGTANSRRYAMLNAVSVNDACASMFVINLRVELSMVPAW